MVIKDDRLKKLKKIFEYKKCELIEVDMSMVTNKYKFIASCGHKCKMFRNSPRLKEKYIICLSCNIEKQRVYKRNNIKNNDINKQEYDGIMLMKELIGCSFDIKFMNEGCRVDILIKPKNLVGDWIPVQIKTTQKLSSIKQYGFHHTKNYNDILLICICIEEEKFWIFDGSKIKNNTITIGYKKSKWDKNFILNKNLNNKLNEKYLEYKKVKYKDVRLMVPKTKLIELKYQDKRDDKYLNLDINYPILDNCVFDCIINGYKVQDKTTYRDKCKSLRFSVNLDRPKRRLPYRKGDNDFYWFNLRDTYDDYFYLIPEFELIDNGYIQVDNEKTTKKLRFYPETKNNKIKTKWCNKYLYKYGDKIEFNKVIN